MCDSGPFVFRKEEKCTICGASPAAKTDEYTDDDTYCKKCAVETFGTEEVSNWED